MRLDFMCCILKGKNITGTSCKYCDLKILEVFGWKPAQPTKGHCEHIEQQFADMTSSIGKESMRKVQT